MSVDLSQPAHLGRDPSESAVRVNPLTTAWQNPSLKVLVPVSLIDLEQQGGSGMLKSPQNPAAAKKAPSRQ